MVSHEDYKPVTTQLFPRDDPYLETDSVFAVKDDLVIDFTPLEDKEATLELKYSVTLAPKNSKKVSDTPLSTIGLTAK
jgi:catechol 1,2-dioxygenase